MNLIKYEMNKRWKALRYVFLGYVFLQTVLLITMKFVLWKNDVTNIFTAKQIPDLPALLTLSMLGYVFFTTFIVLFPFIEGIYRHERDISGNQAIFELMLPVASWKKIFSKVVSTLTVVIISTLIGLLSTCMFLLVNINFDKMIMNKVIETIADIFKKSPGDSIILLLFIAFVTILFYMICVFCATFPRVFSHKKRIAEPMAGLGFVILLWVTGSLEIQIDKISILKYKLFSVEFNIGSNLIEIATVVILFLATAYLMEKKIEC